MPAILHRLWKIAMKFNAIEYSGGTGDTSEERLKTAMSAAAGNCARTPMSCRVVSDGVANGSMSPERRKRNQRTCAALTFKA